MILLKNLSKEKDVSKLVRESIENVLQPKTKEDINAEIDPIIQNFVDNISIEEFEEYLLRHSDSPHTKKFIEPNGNYVIATTDWMVDDAIEHFASDIGTGRDRETGEYTQRFPEFAKFYHHLTNNLYDDYTWEYMQKIYDVVADKFHLEW